MADPTYFGRKRRARRARRRRIEARRALGPGHWFRLDLYKGRFFDPSMGRPWEEDSIPFSSARIAFEDYWKDEQKRLTIHFIDPSIP
jgi:hypothetical protein